MKEQPTIPSTQTSSQRYGATVTILFVIVLALFLTIIGYAFTLAR